MQGAVRRRLIPVFEAAASFSERISSEFFVPDLRQGPAELNRRIDGWVQMVRGQIVRPQADEPPGGSVEEVLARLSEIGIPVVHGLRPVRLRDPDILPAWAEAVVTFVEAQDGSSQLSGFHRAAQALYPTEFLDRFRREITAEAWGGIAEDLVMLLRGVCDPCMRFEMGLLAPERAPTEWADTPSIGSTREEWMSRLERMPGLAFVLGTACANWRRNMVEMLRRLDKDTDRLAQLPFSIDASDPLTEVQAGAGDRHDGGRSVALLRFASGRGVVYKPKDLRHGEAMMALLEFLNEGEAPLKLSVRGILPRGEYGWEERIAPAPTTEPGGFSRFYRRLGMLTRLVQVLSGRDFWADNLLAAGEFPHFIDLECLFTAPVQPRPSLPAQWRNLTTRLDSTVLSTAIPLMAWMPSPDMPGRDFGCLSHADELITGWGTPLPLAPYRPWTEGEVADPWEYAEEVEQGFRDMHELLLRERTALLADDGPLQGFLGVPVRYIRRSTSEYYQILRTSLQPYALINGMARDTLLATLYSEVLSDGAFAEGPSLGELAITRGEVDALRHLDVPTFTSLTTSTSLFPGSAVEIPEHFQETAERYVRRGIAHLNVEGLETDVRFLRTAIDAARGGAECPLPSHEAQSVCSASSALSVDEAAEEADRIAALVRDARLAPLGIGRGWLGLFWCPIHDVWGVGPAGHDLLGGALGPVMFLAAHCSVTENSRSGAVALEAFEDILRAHALGGANSANRLLPRESLLGGRVGPGAVAYAGSHAARWLCRPELAVAPAEWWFPTASEIDDIDDQPLELAETLLHLLRGRQFGFPSSAALDAIGTNAIAPDLALRSADTLRQRLSLPMAPCAASERMADWFPVGADKIVLALATFLSHYPNSRSRPDIEQAIRAHEFDLDRRGGRLAAMAVSRLLGVSAQIGCGRLSVDRHALGSRALLQRIEEAQLATKCLGDPDARKEAGLCLRIVIDRKAATGRWFPDRLADDSLNLSGLDGMPALGLALLRHIKPDIPALGILE